MKSHVRKGVIKGRMYHPSFARVAETLAARGYVPKEIAAALRISPMKFRTWRRRIPEFGAAYDRGRDFCDTEVIENSLRARAIGFRELVDVTYEKQIAEVMDFETGETTLVERMVPTKKVVKQLPPSVQAIALYLKNRAPDRWRDRVELEHSMNDELINRLMEARRRAIE
jgi:hypothetical protein